MMNEIEIKVYTTKLNVESHPLKCGYKMYEIPFSLKNATDEEKERHEEYVRESQEWMNKHPAMSTDVADSFGDRGREIDKKEIGVWGHDVVPVLEFLWNKPWNNLALNYVLGLNPSVIRVPDRGTTLDCCSGRITVYLKEDKRTIASIKMEMKVGLFGCMDGHDLRCKLKDPNYQPSFFSECYINDIGIDNALNEIVLAINQKADIPKDVENKIIKKITRSK